MFRGGPTRRAGSGARTFSWRSAACPTCFPSYFPRPPSRASPHFPTGRTCLPRSRRGVDGGWRRGARRGGGGGAGATAARDRRRYRRDRANWTARCLERRCRRRVPGLRHCRSAGGFRCAVAAAERRPHPASTAFLVSTSSGSSATTAGCRSARTVPAAADPASGPADAAWRHSGASDRSSAAGCGGRRWLGDSPSLLVPSIPQSSGPPGASAWRLVRRVGRAPAALRGTGPCGNSR